MSWGRPDRRRPHAPLLVGLLVVACSTAAPTAGPPSEAAATASQGQPSAVTPSPQPTRPTPPDLSARPLVWFAPLPPMPTGPGRPYTGSDDFMDLFDAGADWDGAAGHLGVFKLYGEWVAYHASDAELRTAIAGIASHGLVLAIEMGPLDPPPGCGEGVESFAGLDEAALISGRVRAAGGTLQVVALDEPWYFAHVYDGAQACRWTVDQVAAGVAGFTRAMRAEWPGIAIGDTEPTPQPVDVLGLEAWLGAYREAAGEPFAFLHLDLDWSRSDWASLAHEVGDEAAAEGVPFGVIYNGGAATSDAAWLSIAGRRVLDYAAEPARDPDHVIFQSWMDKPDRVLPESDPLSFTALVDRYAEARGALGELIGGTANLALGGDATASASLDGTGPRNAIDGIADTIWSAGAGPPVSIEVDLGQPFGIAEIRLLVAQSPPGPTDHRLSCRATASGEATQLGRLTGSTNDLDQLTLTFSAPVKCRFVRIRTVASPSWVAWREIEVYAPE